MSADPPVLLLASRRCGECLTTRNRIVTGARAAGIVSDCRATGTHFQCHKSNGGEVVHCRGVHDLLLRDWGGSTAYQLATRFGIEVREVDPEDLLRRESAAWASIERRVSNRPPVEPRR